MTGCSNAALACVCVCVEGSFSISTSNVLTSWHILPKHSYTDRCPPKSHGADREPGKWRHNQPGPCAVTPDSSTLAVSLMGRCMPRSPLTFIAHCWGMASLWWIGHFDQTVKDWAMSVYLSQASPLFVFPAFVRCLNATETLTWYQAVLGKFTLLHHQLHVVIFVAFKINKKITSPKIKKKSVIIYLPTFVWIFILIIIIIQFNIAVAS